MVGGARLLALSGKKTTNRENLAIDRQPIIDIHNFVMEIEQFQRIDFEKPIYE